MAHYKSSTKKGGRVYLRDAKEASKLAHYTQLNNRGYAQKEVVGMSRDVDKHFVALPAGWRKSQRTGKWYFENRKNRSDNIDEKYEAWNSTMTPARKAQTFKHVIVNQTAVLGQDGKPRYVRYIVKYGNYLKNNQNKEKTVRELIAEREARRLAYLNRNKKVAGKKATTKKVTAPKVKLTKEQRKTATKALLSPYLMTDEKRTVTKGRKPTARKSTSKTATLSVFGVKATAKKATAKKITAKKATTKKSTTRKTSKKN